MLKELMRAVENWFVEQRIDDRASCEGRRRSSRAADGTAGFIAARVGLNCAVFEGKF